MATTILAATNMETPGAVYSDAVANVVYIDIQAILSAGATGKVNYTIQRKTTNGDWRTAKDPYGVPLKFTTVDAVQDGIALDGLFAAFLRVKCEIFGGTGTVTLESEIIA